METKLYLSPQMEAVQMHLDQSVLTSSPIGSSDDGTLDLTFKELGDETAW